MIELIVVVVQKCHHTILYVPMQQRLSDGLQVWSVLDFYLTVILMCLVVLLQALVILCTNSWCKTIPLSLIIEDVVYGDLYICVNLFYKLLIKP